MDVYTVTQISAEGKKHIRHKFSELESLSLRSQDCETRNGDILVTPAVFLLKEELRKD